VEPEQSSRDRRKSEALLAAERRYAEGLQEFDYRFQKQLAEYRSQRAWRVMLAIRKAYTLLARRKWRGVAPFLRWALDAALGRDSGLDEFELKFPQVLNFVPESVYQLVANGRGASAGLERRIPSSGKYDVVILPIFDFDCRFQRPQQMAIGLARRGHRVFWISPSRFVAPSSEEAYEPAQLRENLWEIHLRGEPFDLYGGALNRSTEALLIDSISELYKDLGLAAACAILQFPSWRRMGLALRGRFGAKLVYDCMDDWRNWPSEPKPGARSLSDQDELVRESDLLIVTSRELRDSFAKDGATPEIIPNAADFDFFHNAAPSSTLEAIPRPVVGYYGAIADWFDVDLMAEVAVSRPQYSFVLIGEVTLDDIGKLKSLSNVHLLGEKPYRELPSYLRQFAACTLPFRMNQLTRAVDPVKIYEYLSQGKSVVSVPLPELSPLSELLYFAQGPAEFASQIDRAVAENDEDLRQKRISFASQNTWDSRVDALDRAIRARSPLVSILLLTYNSREYVGPCLDSIRDKTAYPSYEIIAVDNHSGDGTPDELKRRAADDSRIQVACLDRNHGFAGGNNIAAGMAKGEYILFLNPDTVVTWGWLDRLIRPLRADPTIGLVAPVSNFSDTETKVNTYYRTLPEMEDFAFRQARENWGRSTPLEVAPLFCGLVPHQVWREVGQLDETFQVGMFEDDDFSFRVRKAGYRIVTAEDCFIHHFGHGSFGKLDPEAFQRIYDENKQRFEAKWGTWPPHKTRQWVTSPLEDPKIPLSEFLKR
jgi:GT2 family glycosyltransferase